MVKRCLLYLFAPEFVCALWRGWAGKSLGSPLIIVGHWRGHIDSARRVNGHFVARKGKYLPLSVSPLMLPSSHSMKGATAKNSIHGYIWYLMNGFI
ncbi:hypothetical protein KCP74_18220 [Salmonella enterica subsp. enterica]|nr:hypothetical protein KCP74_18220 [Salmonella enterica subsp. enterica]